MRRRRRVEPRRRGPGGRRRCGRLVDGTPPEAIAEAVMTSWTRGRTSGPRPSRPARTVDRFPLRRRASDDTREYHRSGVRPLPQGSEACVGNPPADGSERERLHAPISAHRRTHPMLQVIQPIDGRATEVVDVPAPVCQPGPGADRQRLLADLGGHGEGGGRAGPEVAAGQGPRAARPRPARPPEGPAGGGRRHPAAGACPARPADAAGLLVGRGGAGGRRRASRRSGRATAWRRTGRTPASWPSARTWWPASPRASPSTRRATPSSGRSPCRACGWRRSGSAPSSA